MSLRWSTPCDEPDLDGHHHCPYADGGDYVNCEYWCGADEPEDEPEEVIYEAFDEPEEWTGSENPMMEIWNKATDHLFRDEKWRADK